MKVILASDLVHKVVAPALDLPPGTPVVGLDADGKPVAFGLNLSLDPAKRAAELETAKASVFGDAKHFAKYADFVGTMFGGMADFRPEQFGVLGKAETAIAIVSHSAQFIDAARAGDGNQMVVKSIKTGLDAIDLAQKYGYLSQYQWLPMAVFVAKGVSGLFDLASELKT